MNGSGLLDVSVAEGGPWGGRKCASGGVIQPDQFEIDFWSHFWPTFDFKLIVLDCVRRAVVYTNTVFTNPTLTATDRNSTFAVFVIYLAALCGLLFCLRPGCRW
jgi:hypothetical protein